MPFDPESAFAPVSQVANMPLVLVCPTTMPADKLADFVALARRSKEKLSYASPGSGSSLHLAMESFKQVTGIEAEHIAYKSGPEAVQSLLSGQVGARIADLPLVLPHIRSGSLRALAVAGPVRLSQLPDVPTLDESGVRGVVAASWFGLVAPARTPAPVIDKLNALVARALREPDLVQRFETGGAKLRASRPEEFAAYIVRQRAESQALIRSANIRMQ